MVKRGSHYICMLIIYLLIMPVLHTAEVFAYFSADVHGYDGVVGFRKSSSDVTIINITAGIPGMAIDASQVKVLSDPTRRFDCEFNNVTTLTECELEIPGVLPPGPRDYEVQLFNMDLTEAEPKQVLTIYSDNLAPDIHSFGLERNGSDILASYRVSDRTCDSCDPNICSGVSSIEFFLNYVKVGEVIPDPATCALPLNTTILDIPPVPGTQVKTVCIEAYDRLDQKSSECKDIVMDFTDPKIINVSLWLDGNMLRYTKGEPTSNVILKAYIKEDSELNISSIIADFSSLNARPEWGTAYKHIDMSPNNQLLFDTECSNVSEGIYLCTWSKLLIYIPENIVPNIRISVLDTLENKMNESFTIPIVFDNTDPIVTGARTGIADDRNRYWIGKSNNSIYVDITEDGAGLYNSMLLLDFNTFGPQPYAEGKTVLRANRCEPGWTCMFEGIQVVKPHTSGELLPVTVTFGSVDDANNPVGGSTNLAFYYDNEAPQIISVENSSICPTAPDTIDISVTVSERYSGGVKAKVSAPELSMNSFPQEVDCEETETAGIWTCDIIIDGLTSLYTEGTINLTLEDRAGNSNTTTFFQEVCEAAPGVPPNVVRTVSRVKLFPTDGIDRMVAGKTAFPLFWQPDPSFNTGRAEIQDIKIDGCTIENSTVTETYIMTPLNMKNPMFSTKISLPTDVLSVENESAMCEYLTMSCQLSMTVRAGTKVYQQPEVENVIFEVPLHNTVFGELDESMQDKLEDIEDEIENVEAEIASLKKDFDWAGTFCSIAEVIMKILMVLQVLKMLLYAIGWAVYAVVSAVSGTASGESAGGTVYYLPCFIIDYMTSQAIANIWQVDSSFYITYASVGYLPKFFCGWATCKYTEAASLLELTMNLGQTNSGKFSGKVDNVYFEGEDNYLSADDFEDEVDIEDDVAILLEGGSNKFSAYRSYPLAEAFKCFPAMIYGKKKERQTLCMKRNCYKNLVSSGFSPEICDRLHAARDCMYVDGAFYKVIGGDLFTKGANGLIEYFLLQQGATSGMSIGARAAGCGYPHSTLTVFSEGLKYSQIACGEAPNSALYFGWKSAVICAPLIMTIMYTDIGDWLTSDDFGNLYAGTLGDPDYCEMDE